MVHVVALQPFGQFLRLRYKIAFGVGEAHGQFPRRQGGLLQRQLDDALANVVWNAVPDAIWFGMSVVQGFRPAGLGRERYERAEGEASGYRNGYRTGRLKTAEGAVEFSAPQLRDTAEPWFGPLVTRN
jgi:Transposase, Mutator family